MYSVSINEENFSIEHDGEVFLINGKVLQWDLHQVNERHFNIIYDHKSYNVELIRLDHKKKSIILKLNNKQAEVSIKDKFDLLLEKLGINGREDQKNQSISAPMPGLILDIKVKEGDQVKKNQPLLILEAMKMENLLKASGDGTVKEILVSKGDSVEKNQVLVQF
ncbi:acetyl-CoA carboxylase biotin carboxyl carrier protein subunit [Echinicola marina]|uniref:acetyl-CoA carboxylase biotin carboxyl carrier protein subunit n=1 Tax=Echinicola marina TaxID=2859768 RepID=UPI001CF639FB|nr:acetyl-CoA carboxylase biotin carboxyl carrier protein subunit [Echinicola marina]UCS93703.1 acetyl-CoA carboxylase biotin carboxyl carrier protein subunit [Echinicola marina]